MRIRLLLPLLSLFLFLIGCTEKTETAKTEQARTLSMQQQLLGEWYNVTLKVDFNAVDTADVTVPDMNVDSATWESTLQIKPILTTFRADSSWTSVYKNLNDSVVRVASGVWWTVGDTLIFRTMLPEPAADERFFARVAGDSVVFDGLIDFDQDGALDDHYLGVQRRVADTGQDL
jgi:hypothetical protein